MKRLVIDEVSNGFIISFIPNPGIIAATFICPDWYEVCNRVEDILREPKEEKPVEQEGMEEVQETEEIRSGISGIIQEGDLESEHRPMAQDVVDQESPGKDTRWKKRRQW